MPISMSERPTAQRSSLGKKLKEATTVKMNNNVPRPGFCTDCGQLQDDLSRFGRCKGCANILRTANLKRGRERLQATLSNPDRPKPLPAPPGRGIPAYDLLREEPIE